MNPKQNWWECPAQYLKGVGPKRSELLARLGIKTAGDILYHFPRRYEDRRRITPIRDVQLGQMQTIMGKVAAKGITKTHRGFTILRVAIDDGTGVIYAAWFNQPYLGEQFSTGSSVYVSGRIDFHKEMQIVNPAYEVVREDTEERLESGCIVPIYPLTRDLNQRQMRRILRNAVDKFSSSFTEFLPFSIRDRHNLENLPRALRRIHFPKTKSDWETARRRLIFDEFFLMQFALARRKTKRAQTDGIRHKSPGHLFEKLKDSLPFPLTEAQLHVTGEIRKDMGRSQPMNRLLQGEVGSGKTVVAIAAILTAAESGCQSALMAPTEILAEQHYLTIQKFLFSVGLKINILTGSLSHEMKEETIGEIETGQCDLVVGTHALLEEKVKFRNLGLVVVDEQHKFGVRQREALKQKGAKSCDLLMMTATPIPRSLAMTAYGDLDISTIDELPPGRREISTYLISEKERTRLYDFVREEIQHGRQAYIVYPLIEESDTSCLKAATEMAEHLHREVFPELGVGLLHGRMNGKEKQKIMQDFEKGELSILICTTVIEVGIDVPNASVMIIENAERFGLAQLHQMRGRVGRGDYPSYCILIGNPATGEAKTRLEVLAGTTDGFQIAEQDLELRGPGEFLGTKQHGIPELRLGSISSDLKLLETARREAFSLLENDPDLDKPGHRKLKVFLKERFPKIF